MKWATSELARMTEIVVREEVTNLAFQSIDFSLKILVKNNAVFVAQVGAQLQWYIAFESRCI